MQDRSFMNSPRGLNRPRLLTEKQAAFYIGMSRSFLRQSRMDGSRQNRTQGPPYLKIGRKVLYLAEDLDNWLLEHRRAD